MRYWLWHPGVNCTWFSKSKQWAAVCDGTAICSGASRIRDIKLPSDNCRDLINGWLSCNTTKMWSTYSMGIAFRGAAFLPFPPLQRKKRAPSLCAAWKLSSAHSLEVMLASADRHRHFIHLPPQAFYHKSILTCYSRKKGWEWILERNMAEFY